MVWPFYVPYVIGRKYILLLLALLLLGFAAQKYLFPGMYLLHLELMSALLSKEITVGPEANFMTLASMILVTVFTWFYGDEYEKIVLDKCILGDKEKSYSAITKQYFPFILFSGLFWSFLINTVIFALITY